MGHDLVREESQCGLLAPVIGEEHEKGDPLGGLLRADPALAPWYQSLEQPGTGYPCCSISDCRTVQYRTVADHFEAFIDRRTFGEDAPDDWLPVPPEHVLHRRDNPTGEAVVCWYNGEIRCFVEGAGI